MLIDLYGNDPDIDGFRFCKKIMKKYSPTAWKPHINHLCIKNDVVYSTDGARLHYYRSKCPGRYIDGLWAVTICRAGLVQIAKSKFGTDKFPNAEDMFNLNEYIHLGEKRFDLDGFHYAHAVFAIVRYGINVNPKYVADIGGYFDIMVTSDNSKFQHKPIIFVNGNKRAAIMPMRFMD